MMTLHPNEIKACYNRNFFSIWGHFPQSSEVFGKSEMFGSGRDVSGNPSHNKVKPHVFDLEKIGRYNIGT